MPTSCTRCMNAENFRGRIIFDDFAIVTTIVFVADADQTAKFLPYENILR